MIHEVPIHYTFVFEYQTINIFKMLQKYRDVLQSTTLPTKNEISIDKKIIIYGTI